MAERLTRQQVRVLDFLASHGDWAPIMDLRMLWTMGEDDDLFVPGLVERGLIEHCFGTRAVRITEAGRQALRPTSSNGGDDA